MSTKTFNLSLPSELVALIDEQAKREYATRSDYIKRAIIAQLKANGGLNATPTFRTLDEAQRARLKTSFEAHTDDEYTDDLD